MRYPRSVGGKAAVILPILVSALCGLVIGCFLNTMVYRLSADQKSVITEDCFCPVCGHTLALWEQIPILGYLLLRGKCRYCQTPIDAHYPLVEGGCAVLYALLAWLCLPRIGLLALLGLLCVVLLSCVLIRRDGKLHMLRRRKGKVVCAGLLLLFYHVLTAAAVAIVMMAYTNPV